MSTQPSPAPLFSITASQPPPPRSRVIHSPGVPVFNKPSDVYDNMQQLLTPHNTSVSPSSASSSSSSSESSPALVRNYVAVIEDMSAESMVVETELFPRDALEFYSKYNLNLLDLDNNDRDRSLHQQYYTPARGGGQGDYRVGIERKIANVVDCLRKFPNSKRAVLSVPHASRVSVEDDHTDTDEAKCLREIHFYLETDGDVDSRLLCASGLMRAQAVSIFPKNIHFIGTLMHHVAQQLGGGVKVGRYTHFVTTLVAER